MSDKVYDAVIVGAGMSGLAAGVRLAQFDYNVCILEKHGVIGGSILFTAITVENSTSDFMR